MSTLIYPQGTALFTLAALDDLAVFSLDGFKVFTKTTFSNYPEVWTLAATGVAGIETTVAATSTAREVKIEVGAAEALYHVGTEATIVERRGLRGQGTPGVLDATGALTAGMMLSGIVTSAAAAVTATVPTGTVMDAAIEMEIGDSFDWAVIKVGANSFTVTAATAHTLVGSGVVATATSITFRTRKTAAATYVTYRIG